MVFELRRGRRSSDGASRYRCPYSGSIAPGSELMWLRALYVTSALRSGNLKESTGSGQALSRPGKDRTYPSNICHSQHTHSH